MTKNIKKDLLGLSIVVLALFLITKFNLDNEYQPKEGDFLFQDLDCGPTCDAIEAVTWGVDSVKFSHIGFVVNVEDEFKVLEAILSGVVLTSIDDFLNRSSDEYGNPKVWIGRLKKDYQHQVSNSLKLYQEYLGIEYDDEFIYNNGKYYCSELIYDVFKKANGNNPFFELEPMTFKSLKTGEFFPVWIDYYKNLELDIPQDSLGINPAGISRSNKMKIIQKLGKVQN